MSRTLTSFGVELTDQLKDVFLALALSETVYRVLDPGGLQQAVRVADDLCKGLPYFSDVELKLHWSTPDLAHRYMLGETHDALYVAFMGTKQRRDILSNTRIGMAPLWPKEFPATQEGPQAHRGFLRRARAVDIQSLYRHASQKGLRLVLCGHSLGGAVAQICTLDLLHSLEDSSEAGRVPISCIGYATPAIGNASLTSMVREKGWHSFFINYVLPEDVLGSFFGRHTHPTLADIPAAPAGVQVPADYSLLAKSARKRSSAEQQTWAPKEEPLSLNNIVPCQHSQSGMVFREPLHLGLGSGSPLVRDLLSGARGEMSSMSLEMADANPWLFRNDIHSRRHCTTKATAAGIPRSTLSTSTAAQQPAHVLLERVNLANTAREIEMDSSPKANLAQGGWLFPAGGMRQRSGSKATSYTDSSKLKADLLQAPSPASAAALDDNQEEVLLSPCTSFSSTSSSLNCLDDDEKAIPIAAEDARAPDILRRARILASALLLPVSVLAGYRPIGRQWRLAKPGRPAAAPDAAAVTVEKLVSALEDGSAPTAEQDPVLAKDVSQLDALQRRLRTIFWMHRLPVYRARVREIYDSAAGADTGSGNGLHENRAEQNRAWLADVLAPNMHVERARFIMPSDNEMGSSTAVLQNPTQRPFHAPGSIAGLRKGLLILASLLTAVWLLLWARISRGCDWWAKLRSLSSHVCSATVFIAVYGQGLQHCSAAAVEILGDVRLHAVVVQKPSWDGGKPLALQLAWKHLTSASAMDDPQLLLLSVQVSQAKLSRLQLENSSSLTLQSDFYTIEAAIEASTNTL